MFDWFDLFLAFLFGVGLTYLFMWYFFVNPMAELLGFKDDPS